MGGHQSARAATTDWLTPRWILDALGVFDLDPCSAPDPTVWPTARNHITRSRDGLALPHWYGRVWLNPPYGREAGPWIHRMAEHGWGTALLFGRFDADWFQIGVGRCPHVRAMLLLDGRVKFHRATDLAAPDNGGAPSVLIAYGDRDSDILSRSGLPGWFLPVNGWQPPPPLPVASATTMPTVTPGHAKTGIDDRTAAGWALAGR